MYVYCIGLYAYVSACLSLFLVCNHARVCMSVCLSICLSCCLPIICVSVCPSEGICVLCVSLACSLCGIFKADAGVDEYIIGRILFGSDEKHLALLQTSQISYRRQSLVALANLFAPVPILHSPTGLPIKSCKVILHRPLYVSKGK